MLVFSSGAGVDGAKGALTALFWVVAALLVTALLLFAAFLALPAFLAGAFLALPAFLAGAFLAAVFRAAFFVVFFAPDFFVPDLADFLVDFFAATLRDRAFAALFFFEALAPPFRALLAFLLLFLAAMSCPLLRFRLDFAQRSKITSRCPRTFKNETDLCLLFLIPRTWCLLRLCAEVVRSPLQTVDRIACFG
jgi:hypothetical protein